MAIGLVAAATIAVAGLAVWWHNGPPRPTTVTFEPPYPQVNAAGDPILAVFEGRIPCSSPHCERRKWGSCFTSTPQREARARTGSGSWG
jgi:disulfide bond formation protein DsbB